MGRQERPEMMAQSGNAGAAATDQLVELPIAHAVATVLGSAEAIMRGRSPPELLISW